MKLPREFDIEFIKLKEGEHTFEFQITDAFFEAFNSSLSGSDLKVVLTLQRAVNMLTLDFYLKGSVKTECDRCLSEMNLPLESRHTVVVKITEMEKESEDDLVFLTPHDHKINVAQHIYDFICLAIPIKKVCADAGAECDDAVAGRISSIIDVSTDDADDLPEADTDEETETY